MYLYGIFLFYSVYLAKSYIWIWISSLNTYQHCCYYCCCCYQYCCYFSHPCYYSNQVWIAHRSVDLLQCREYYLFYCYYCYFHQPYPYPWDYRHRHCSYCCCFRYCYCYCYWGWYCCGWWDIGAVLYAGFGYKEDPAKLSLQGLWIWTRKFSASRIRASRVSYTKRRLVSQTMYNWYWYWNPFPSERYGSITKKRK